MPLPDPDTWATFSDKYLLPDSLYYGDRHISLKRIWELASRRTTVLDSARAYKAVFDIYCDEVHTGTGEDGEFTSYDEGWANGVFLALNLIRAAFNLPVPLPPIPPTVPPTVGAPTVHPGKELI